MLNHVHGLTNTRKNSEEIRGPAELLSCGRKLETLTRGLELITLDAVCRRVVSSTPSQYEKIESCQTSEPSTCARMVASCGWPLRFVKLFGRLAGGTVPSEVEPPIVPAECGRARGVLLRHVDPALILERSFA
jgi:hypothetical protein